jgi:hypothetical protein
VGWKEFPPPLPQVIVDQSTAIQIQKERNQKHKTGLFSLHRNTIRYKIQMIRDELQCVKQLAKFR